MQLSVIQFTVKMFHTGFMPVLILQSKCQYYKSFKTLNIVLFTVKLAKIILLLQFSWSQSVWWLYTGCPRRNGQKFGTVFLMLDYTDITQNTYIQSWTVTEIMAREVWNFDSCYTLIDYQVHIKWQEYVVSVMLITVLNIKLTCEWHKAIKLNYKNTRSTVVFVLRFPSNLHRLQLSLISPKSLHSDVS